MENLQLISSGDVTKMLSTLDEVQNTTSMQSTLDEVQKRTSKIEGVVEQQQQQLLLTIPIYDLATLQARGEDLPASVDPRKKEQHLSDDDFEGHFGMCKEEFSNLPNWKQVQMKRDLNIF